MVKILGISGSPRKAATYYAMTEAMKAAEEIEGVETELISLAGKKINPCIGCNRCVKEGIVECLLYQDDMNELYKHFFEYDGVLIGSPVYSMGITGQLASFLSRFRPEYLNVKDNPYKYMFIPGAALAVGGTRNGGQEMTINVIHGFYHTKGLPIVNGGLGVYGGAAVWSQDKMKEGARDDLKGMENARIIGKKLALTAKRLKGE